MKKGEDKMMQEGETSNKLMDLSGMLVVITELTCVNPLKIPGIGSWDVGDTITDKVTISMLKENPCFKISKED